MISCVIRLPSLLESRPTNPARHVSVTSAILVAHLPMACIVWATNCLSALLTYVCNEIKMHYHSQQQLKRNIVLSQKQFRQIRHQSTSRHNVWGQVRSQQLQKWQYDIATHGTVYGGSRFTPFWACGLCWSENHHADESSVQHQSMSTHDVRGQVRSQGVQKRRLWNSYLWRGRQLTIHAD